MGWVSFKQVGLLLSVYAPLEHSLALVDRPPTLLRPALSPCDQTLFGKILLIYFTMILCLYLLVQILPKNRLKYRRSSSIL